MFPALAGGFLPTVPLGKSYFSFQVVGFYLKKKKKEGNNYSITPLNRAPTEGSRA